MDYLNRWYPSFAISLFPYYGKGKKTDLFRQGAKISRNCNWRLKDKFSTLFLSFCKLRVKVEFPMGDVEKLTINQKEAGVNDVVGGKKVSFAITESTLKVYGLKAGEKVAVYSISGVCLISQTADSEGSLSMSIENLDSGVYVVAAGSNSFKFIK